MVITAPALPDSRILRRVAQVLDQPMESGIQRTGFDLEKVFRRSLNMLGDRMAVRGARKQRPQDEQFKGALQQAHAINRCFGYCVDTLLHIM